MPFQEYCYKKAWVGIQLTRYVAYIQNDFSPQSLKFCSELPIFSYFPKHFQLRILET